MLKLLAKRCSFAAPRLCFESPDGLFNVRSKVTGTEQMWEIVERLKQRPALAAQTGEAIAQILIEQHTQDYSNGFGGLVSALPVLAFKH